MSLRKWQKTALAAFKSTPKDLLVEACVGAGKTTAAAHMAAHALAEGDATFVLAVVPTVELKQAFARRFKSDTNIEMVPTLFDKRGRPREYQAGAITYAQLPNIVSTIETWCRNGERLLVFFDEIHHCAGGDRANEWGSAAEALRRVSARSVCLTGTPFRSDGRQISFVRYSDDGKAKPDVRYTYEQAVADGVCRHVTFIHDDGIASYSLDGETHEHRISETQKPDKSLVSGCVFMADGPRCEFMENLIAKTDAMLDDIRLTDRDAGCVVICRPGRDHEGDDAYVERVAKAIERITGEAAVVVTHRDNGASGKIDAFRNGTSKYIVAVRMISEGIDIPRLRVLLMANTTDSEMLFRQMVGRIVRQETDDPEAAFVLMAKFPPMSDFAERMREEAVAGVQEIESRKKEVDSELERNATQLSYFPLGATHEDGGAISWRDKFSAEEVAEAESVKASDPALRHVPLHVILHARRATVDPKTPPATMPRHVRIKAKRAELSQRLRQLGAIRGGGDHYKDVGTQLWRSVGVRDINDLCDNHPEERIDEAISIARRLISESTRVPA